MSALRTAYRRLRVQARKLLGSEPRVPQRTGPALTFVGNDYCGWRIPLGCVNAQSLVIDVGLGEDISFSTELIARHGCTVHGFDPTPRSIAYVQGLAPERFVLHAFGLAAEGGQASFFLPNDTSHVSGSLSRSAHTGRSHIEVQLLSMSQMIERVGDRRIALLKIDIEGAEYAVLQSEDFAKHAERIDVLCIEFHHRWPEHGPSATLQAVQRLQALGFVCVWSQDTTNEEFTFIRRGATPELQIA